MPQSVGELTVSHSLIELTYFITGLIAGNPWSPWEGPRQKRVSVSLSKQAARTEAPPFPSVGRRLGKKSGLGPHSGRLGPKGIHPGLMIFVDLFVSICSSVAVWKEAAGIGGWPDPPENDLHCLDTHTHTQLKDVQSLNTEKLKANL